MTIQPIVEGHGEVAAVPILLRRLAVELTGIIVDVARPIRVQRTQLLRADALVRYVELARRRADAVLILIDADDDCSARLFDSVGRPARAAATPVPCEFVAACREYEAWFLASIESLRGRRGISAAALSHPSPEAPRGGKGHMEARMDDPRRGYSEVDDQPALTTAFDLVAAHAQCRSFRRMVSAFGHLVVGGPVSQPIA